jgi:hypothetical protein
LSVSETSGGIVVSKKSVFASTSVALSTLILSSTASAIEFKWGDVDGSFKGDAALSIRVAV